MAAAACAPRIWFMRGGMRALRSALAGAAALVAPTACLSADSPTHDIDNPSPTWQQPAMWRPDGLNALKSLKGWHGLNPPEVQRQRHALGWSLAAAASVTTSAHNGSASAPAGARDAPTGLSDRQLQIGLSLTASRPMDDLRRSMQLRVDISDTTALRIQPRRSRVLVELHSQW